MSLPSLLCRNIITRFTVHLALLAFVSFLVNVVVQICLVHACNIFNENNTKNSKSSIVHVVLLDFVFFLAISSYELTWRLRRALLTSL